MGWLDWLRRAPAEKPEDVARIVEGLIDRLDAQDVQGMIAWYPLLGTTGHELYNLTVPADSAARAKLQQHCLANIRAQLDEIDGYDLEELLGEIEKAKLPLPLDLYRHRIAYAERSQLERVRRDVATAVRDRDLETLIRGFEDLDDEWDLDLEVPLRETLRGEIGAALAKFLPSPFARGYERMRDLLDDVSGDPAIEVPIRRLERPLRTVEPEPINAELDRVLAAATTDAEHRDASLVLADWLQERDHPRGKLIALDLAGEPTADFIIEHAEELLGSLARFKVFGALGWRRGFVERAVVSSLDPQCGEILHHVLAQRGLAELAIGINIDNAALIQRMVDMIAAARPQLRALLFTDLPDEEHGMQSHDTDFRALWPALPGLRTLVIHNQTPMIDGVDLPELERAMWRLEVPGEVTIAALAAAQLPKLHTLDVWFDESDYEDYRAILRGRTLTHLGLINTPMTDHVCPFLESTAPTLIELDLTNGSLSDDGAERLAAMRLPRLERLEITNNAVSAKGFARLRKVYANVIG